MSAFAQQRRSASTAADPTNRLRREKPTLLVIKPFDQRGVVESLIDIWRHRELLFILASRAVTVRYKQAVVGVLWVVIQPVIATAIFSVVFGLFAHLPSEGVPYPVFVFSGLLIWNYFSRLILEGSASLLANAPLITKVYFPRLLVPLVPPAAGAVDCAIATVVLFGAALLFGVMPGWRVVFVPLIIVWAGVLGYAACLWLAPLYAIYRDFVFLIPFVVQLAMFTSPIIYSSALVPEKYRLLYSLNPISTLVDAMRWALFDGAAPSVAAFAALVLATSMILGFGVRFFHRMEATLVDRI
jgi:lipopolysaccharide transport system permease protein